MIMKGGILLALGYESTRYTKGIDFSTAMTLQDIDQEAFVQRIDEALTRAVERLDYGLDCLVQKHKQLPPGEAASFPTIRVNIGYAYKSQAKLHRRLLRRQSTQVLQVDYSLNEPTQHPDLVEIGDGEVIRTYSFTDLVAEKFRAILQQEVRNRFRRQDIYDLHLIIFSGLHKIDEAVQSEILAYLKEKAEIRGLDVHRDSMANPEIIRRSQAEYNQLTLEIEGELPPFEQLYAPVRAFYESLPW
jgi:hypothetical protein